MKQTESEREFGEETFWKTVTYDQDINGSERNYEDSKAITLAQVKVKITPV
jgi:hypothetical protein